MQPSTKINRGHLVRAARKGELWLKCTGRYTDDYAYDNATNFGKQDRYHRVRLPEKDFESTTEDYMTRQSEWRAWREAERQRYPDCQLMDIRDFTYKTGSVFGNTFWIHANLCYDFIISKEDPNDAHAAHAGSGREVRNAVLRE